MRRDPCKYHADGSLILQAGILGGIIGAPYGWFWAGMSFLLVSLVVLLVLTCAYTQEEASQG